MSEQFKSLAIIGPGLLGGSLALATKDTHEVRLWGRNPQKIQALQGAGFSLVSTDIRAVIEGADLIVLATPVPYMRELVTQIIAAGLTTEQLITDVGSVKTSIIDELQPLLGAQGYSFIGSHPMAGSESQGFDAASASLFHETACIITPDEYTKTAQLASLDQFWSSVGGRTHLISPEDHDDIISRVSHMPHILAAICAHVALPSPENGNYSGNGLKDTSRIASGDAQLWTGILTENKQAIMPHLDEAIARLTSYKQALTSEDTTELTQLLAQDKQARDSYYMPESS